MWCTSKVQQPLRTALTSHGRQPPWTCISDPHRPPSICLMQEQPDGGRSCELRDALQIAAVEQDYLEVTAEICPGGVARGAFRDKDGGDFRVTNVL